MKRHHTKRDIRTPAPGSREAAAFGPRLLKDPTSVEYAWQTASWLKLCFQHKSLSEKDWLAALAEAERHQIYLRVPPEKPYGSMDALLKAEIGLDVETSKATIRERTQRLAEKAEPLAVQRRPTKEEQLDKGVVNTFIRGSTNAEYLTARIARDSPAILEEMKAGKYPSVRAAARAAGIIKTPTILDQLQKYWRKASTKERAAFRSWIEAPQEREQKKVASARGVR